jgi:hypothetical protein
MVHGLPRHSLSFDDDDDDDDVLLKKVYWDITNLALLKCRDFPSCQGPMA